MYIYVLYSTCYRCLYVPNVYRKIYEQSFAKLSYFAQKKSAGPPGDDSLCPCVTWRVGITAMDSQHGCFFHSSKTVGIQVTVTYSTKSKKKVGVCGTFLFINLQVKIHTCNFKSVCCDRIFLLCSEILVASFLQPNTLLSLMRVSWLQLKCLEPASSLRRSDKSSCVSHHLPEAHHVSQDQHGQWFRYFQVGNAANMCASLKAIFTEEPKFQRP